MKSDRHYEIRLREKIDEHWSARLGGLEVHHDGDGTVLRGPLRDGRELHAVIGAAFNLGLTLVSVRSTEPTTSSWHHRAPVP